MELTAAEATSGQPGSRRFRLQVDGATASWQQVIALWATASFAQEYSVLLVSSGFAAFRWETPRVSTASLAEPFEYVVANDPELVRTPDNSAFADSLAGVESVATFANLGGDATLIAPCGVTGADHYAHLGDFLRLAPAAQVVDLWHAVSVAMETTVAGRGVWLNTAGAGVPWLHVRLDSSPKYYRYSAYRQR